MVAQDNYFTVTEYDPDGTSQSRILTVSEGGYDIDETTGEFRIDAPHIAADLQGEHPRTTWGTLVAALRARRSVGHEPFTFLSCDNLRSNGDTARRSTVGFAEAVDLELAAWISGNVAFPNSKVDRIAPVIDDQVRVTVNELTGVNDAVPVVVESFKQWVVEDEFPTGRPAWEVVGVQLRPDVAAFESIKGRMLNASHVIMSYPSLICGFEFVNDAAHDDLMPFDVDPHGAGLDDPGYLRIPFAELAPAQQRTYPRDQLAQPIWLGDVIVGADLETDDCVDLRRLRGHHDNGHRRTQSELPTDVEPGYPGEHHVEEDDVGRKVIEPFERGSSIRRDRNPKTLPLEAYDECIGVGRLVLDYQDLVFARHLWVHKAGNVRGEPYQTQYFEQP